jgi:cytochrome c553
LAGQPRQYFINQIDAFKNHQRTDMAMTTNAASLSDQDIADLAEFFATQKPPAYPTFDADRAILGKKLLPQLSCDACHGRTFVGQANTPRLAGQSPKYTAWQLRSFKRGTRNHPMADASAALESLPDDQIDILAHAFASME